MSAKAIVDLLSELVSVGAEEYERLHGVSALNVLYEVQAALMATMESDLSYVVLWEQFLLTPHEVDQALVSVILALSAADPVLANWLDEALERHRLAVNA